METDGGRAKTSGHGNLYMKWNHVLTEGAAFTQACTQSMSISKKHYINSRPQNRNVVKKDEVRISASEN